MAGENVLGAPVLDPFVITYTSKQYHGAPSQTIEMKPCLLLREILPVKYPQKWIPAFNHVFCEFDDTLKAFVSGKLKEVIPLVKFTQSYGFDTFPPIENHYAWATLIRVHIAHTFMYLENTQSRVSLRLQLFIDSHLQFVVFLRSYAGSLDTIDEDIRFHSTYPLFNRVLYQAPDMRPALLQSDLFYDSGFSEVDESSALHLFIEKVLPFKCSNRNHGSMINNANLKDPSIGHIFKLLFAQMLMGYSGGHYRPRFVTRLVLSQWLMIFAQARFVDLKEFLTRRKNMAHLVTLEAFIYQLQFAMPIQLVLQQSINLSVYEEQVYESADYVRKAFDGHSDIAWLKYLPDQILPVGDNPTIAEMTRATKLMSHVREFFDGIIMPLEPFLKSKKTEYGKFMLRRSSFSPEAASQLKKKLRKIDPSSVPRDMRQIKDDPVLSPSQRMRILIIAAHSARRLDKFVEIPLLKWAGVDPRVVKALQSVFKGANRPKNSMLKNLTDMFKPNVYPMYKESLVAAHRFFEDIRRFEEHVIFSLEPMIAEMQKSALLHSMNIVGQDDIGVELGVIYLCRCDTLLSPVVESTNPKCSKSCAGGVINAKYDVVQRFIHCSKNHIDECADEAIRINMLGKVLCIRDKQYVLCVHCGVLTTLSMERWSVGPHCGYHTNQLPPSVYKDVMPKVDVHRLPSYRKYIEALRTNTPPPPNRGIVTKCSFCGMITSKDVGSTSFVMEDDTRELGPVQFRPVHVCNNCNYYVRLIIRDNSSTPKLSTMRSLVIDMISMPNNK